MSPSSSWRGGVRERGFGDLEFRMELERVSLSTVPFLISKDGHNLRL